MAIQGQYRGVNVQSGSDADIAAQIARIDAQQANIKTTIGVEPVTSEALIPTPSLIPAPPLPSQQQLDFNSIVKQFQQPTADETMLGNQQGDLEKRITESIAALGSSGGRRLEAEAQAGLPEQRKQLNEYLAQINAINAGAFEATQVAAERPEQAFLIQGRQAQIARQRAVQTYGLAAAASAVQNNIALSQEYITKALDAEFEVKRYELEAAKFQYDRNRDTLERIDKKRADNLNLVLNERTRLLGIEEADRKEIYDIGKTVASFGAPANVVKEIYNMGTREEALAKAAPYLQDPTKKQALQNAILDNELTRLSIRKTTYELSLLQKYGGLTPSQFADYQKEERKRIADEKEASQKTLQQGIALQEKVHVINAALNSKGFDSAVGTSFVTRTPQGTLGKIGAAISLVGIPSLIGSGIDATTGAKQNFIASVENLVSKEFLDNLINVKSQGAIFGALSDREQLALTAAATKIGTWRVSDKNGNVLHYNVDEASFRAELERIRNLTRTTYERATGKSWLPDEEDFWASLELSQASTNFNPAY